MYFSILFYAVRGAFKCRTCYCANTFFDVDSLFLFYILFILKYIYFFNFTGFNSHKQKHFLFCQACFIFDAIVLILLVSIAYGSNTFKT